MTARRRSALLLRAAAVAAVAVAVTPPPVEGAGITIRIQAASAPGPHDSRPYLRWAANALKSLQQGGDVCDRDTDPVACYEVLDRYFAPGHLIETRGSSWRGEAIPGGAVRRARGNSLTFGFHAFGDGDVRFRLRDITARSVHPLTPWPSGRRALDQARSLRGWTIGCRNNNMLAWDWGADRKKGGGDDVRICERTHRNSGSVWIDEVVYAGSGSVAGIRIQPDEKLTPADSADKQKLQQAIDRYAAAVSAGMCWFRGGWDIVGTHRSTGRSEVFTASKRVTLWRPPDAPDDGGCTPPPWMAPHWRGGGGFVVRPADGLSATVRLECAGSRFTSVEHADADGLIARLVPRSRCEAAGRLLEGELMFDGIEDGGWYWIDGDRNVAVSPLVVEGSLNGGLRPPVPAGVAASPSGDARFIKEVSGRLYGTLVVQEVQEGTGFMGVVPHLVDMEGGGEHKAPYWRGAGGIVGRPLNGKSAAVRLSCAGGEPETWTLEPGADGIVASLLPGGCFDNDGAAVRGHLEADGFEDGAWYWINDAVPFVAPLLGRDSDPSAMTVPLAPGGVEADEGPLGTLFSRGNLKGIVPRLRTAAPP